MAIEKDLKRIADSLEKLADHFIAATPVAPVLTPAQQAAVDAPTPAAPAAPVATQQAAPTPAEVPAQTAPAAPAAPAAMTPEQMNAMLVSEFKRIGDRAPIDAAMQELGVTSVANLSAEQQQALVAKVQAIPGAA